MVIDAAPQAVFDSLTQPEQFCKWFGANVDIEPYVGGRFAMGGFELDPEGPSSSSSSRAARRPCCLPTAPRWELAGSEGQTRLTFVQSGFDPENPPYPGWIGWLAGVAELRRYHELPQWRTIWRQIEAPRPPGRDAQHRRLAGPLTASSFQRGGPDGARHKEDNDDVTAHHVPGPAGNQPRHDHRPAPSEPAADRDARRRG